MNIRDLAKHLNISIGTVSRALNGRPYVDPATRARVLAAAIEFGYTPNFAGRSLRQGTSGMVGMMLPTSSGIAVADTIFMVVLEGLRRFFAAQKLDLLVMLADPDPRDFSYLRRVTDRGLVDGLIIADLDQHDPRITYLLEKKLPFVGYGRSATPGRYAWIDFDLEGAAASAVDRLVRQGHRRIALATTATDVNYGLVVEGAFRKALAEHGLDNGDELVVRIEPSERGGYVFGDRWLALEPRPTAALLANEHMAIGLYRRLAEDGLAPHIRYRHRVTAAGWSAAARRWTVDVTRGDTGELLRYTAGFLLLCPGYYNHDKPHRPRWEGLERYQGLLVHPQQWPQDLDLAGKRVIVIGSGATAATLIPAVAESAAHVTMVQRSPAYFFAPPRKHELAATLESLDVPADWTHEILRRAYIAQSDQLVKTAFEDPEALHQFFIESMRPQLPADFDIGRHFTPRYRPWQQRIGVVPEGDFFAALRSGKASMVTDTIETFTETGLRVSSGEEIPADVVVTATGFTMSLFGDIAFTVDGEPVDFTGRLTWRGVMISGVPNMAYVFGYLRYSWTLRADMVCDLVARLVEHMEARGAGVVVPVLRPQDAGMERRPFCDPENFSAGYIMRSQDILFGQGDRAPWTHMLEYHEERDVLPAADLDDGSLAYS